MMEQIKQFEPFTLERAETIEKQEDTFIVTLIREL
jgi:hypothetical protein